MAAETHLYTLVFMYVNDWHVCQSCEGADRARASMEQSKSDIQTEKEFFLVPICIKRYILIAAFSFCSTWCRK